MSRHHPAHPDFHRTLFNSVVHEPATMLIAAATAVQAIGSISAAGAQASSYKAATKASEANAAIQTQNAARVSAEYSIREDNLRREQQRFLGRQRAGFAESGTGLGTGSALDVAQEDTQNAELDALTLRYEGNTERQGLLTDAAMSRFDAGVSRMNASSAKTAGYIGAVGNVLGGAGRYSDLSNKQAALSTPSGGGSKSNLPWVNGVRNGTLAPNRYTSYY